MHSLGKKLKNQREAKYLTIEEVSQITKIKPKYIIALENEELDQLPPRVYTVGFIQNMAALYQLQPEELIAVYDALNDNFSSRGKDVLGRDGVLGKKRPSTKEMTAFERVQALSTDDDTDVEEVNSFIDSVSGDNGLESFKSDFIDKEFRDIKDKVAKEAELEAEKDFPTSKLVADFEELMREEERFKTQKIRKETLERNIRRTRNMKKNDILNMYDKEKKGPRVMFLILLGVVILLLLYVIIRALLN